MALNKQLSQKTQINKEELHPFPQDVIPNVPPSRDLFDSRKGEDGPLSSCYSSEMEIAMSHSRCGLQPLKKIKNIVFK